MSILTNLELDDKQFGIPYQTHTDPNENEPEPCYRV